ncbi:MAG: patatin-like phospholipase family protein [Anaerolineales bacterium]|nr:patatin-like phospholipase family protein [Anaerolineales bacterium]MBX3035498.1 patatin-like phospholipase family protein [Anaerolineales bacterium]
MEIALALGGGGAKGNAHIGVLRRLEKEGYQIKSIAGTSFGGLVGILYAVGFSPDEIQSKFESLAQKSLFVRGAQDGPSLLGLHGVRSLLNEILGEKTFDDLRIPCAVTAVDLKNGTEVILSEGSLTQAILATIALPGIFPVQYVNDWSLIDGGVLNPVPVSVARMLSPDLPIVAVALTDPLDTPIRGYTIPVPSIFPRQIIERISRISLAQSLDVFLRSVDAGSRAVAYLRLQIDKPDVIVRPDVHHVEILDEVDVADLANRGEQALEEMLPEIKRVTSWMSRARRKISEFIK